MQSFLHWQRSSGFLWLACLGVAALWDFLFWGHPLGVSAALFAGVLVAGLMARSRVLRVSGQGRLLAGVTCLVVLALVEEPSSLGILLIILAVLTLALVAQRDLNLFQDAVSAWVFRWLALAAMLWTRAIRDNILIGRWLVRHPRLGGRVVRLATAIAWWVLPLMAGLLFAGLFALANPVIAQFFSHLLDYINIAFDWLAELSPARVVLWGVVAVAAYGLLRHRHMGRATVRVPPVVTAPQAQWLTGPQMIVRLLLVLNAVFAVENGLDAAYLCFGVPLPAGLDYKQYAHRGAYTLIVTALLAGAFVLGAFRAHGTAHRSRACRWLVYLWIGQNILLLLSTVRRVWLYMEMSELTRLRLSTMIWCGLVAVGFIWIILRIKFHKPNAWLWRMNAFSAAALLIACTFINFDGIIAHYNVRHCAEMAGSGQALDLDYLRYLGPDALTALTWFSEHHRALPVAEQPVLGKDISALRRELDDELSDWRGWSYRRQRVAWETAPLSESALARR